jgi:hypothetical protein
MLSSTLHTAINQDESAAMVPLATLAQASVTIPLADLPAIDVVAVS